MGLGLVNMGRETNERPDLESEQSATHSLLSLSNPSASTSPTGSLGTAVDPSDEARGGAGRQLAIGVPLQPSRRP